MQGDGRGRPGACPSTGMGNLDLMHYLAMWLAASGSCLFWLRSLHLRRRRSRQRMRPNKSFDIPGGQYVAAELSFERPASHIQSFTRHVAENLNYVHGVYASRHCTSLWTLRFTLLGIQ